MNALDKIRISNLRTRCIVGIRDEERKNLQDILINLCLYVDLSQPCESDDINDTVDYSHLKKRILRLVESSSFFLIEKLAQEIADLCLSEQMIEAVDVRVEKPTALRFADSVGVELTRRKS